MTAALIVLSCTVLLLVVALAAGGFVARRALAAARAERDADGYAALIGARVTASVRDGGSIRGVLTHVYDTAIVLAHPEFLGGAKPVGVGSELTVARHDVPMLQRFDSSAPDTEG